MKYRKVQPKPQQENLAARPAEGISGAAYDIASASLFSTIPVLALAGTLLAIVFTNKLDNSSSPSSAPFRNPTLDELGVYYVDFDSNNLTTVASWASSVALLVPGFTMTLLWYYIAYAMQRDSREKTASTLPTPWQLGLLLALRTGDLQPLWEWMSYLFRRRRRRQSPLLRLSGCILVLSILVISLIWAADTWFHVTTKTISYDQFFPISAESLQHYGRAMPAYCGTIFGNCTYIPSKLGANLKNPLELYEVLGNQSISNQVKKAYMNGHRLSFLAPPNVADGLDYKTTSIAARSNCSLATQACQATDVTSGYYNCSILFNAQLMQNSSVTSTRSDGNSIYLGYFANSNWTVSVDELASNPFYTLAQVAIESTESGGDAFQGQTAEIVTSGLAGNYYYMSCETRLLNMTYSVVNGSMTVDATALITEPILIDGLIGTTTIGYTDSQILDGAFLAWFQKTVSQATETFAAQYDATFLAAAASVIETVPDISEQSHGMILVSRVEKLPLFGLVTALVLSAVLGFIMTIVALASSPFASRNVQVRLSILGLTSSRFENLGTTAAHAVSVEELFAEYQDKEDCRERRLGVAETSEGGWDFQSFVPKKNA